MADARIEAHKDAMHARVDAIVREHERMAAALRKLGATVGLVAATALGSQWTSWYKKFPRPWHRTACIVHALPLCGIRVTVGTHAAPDR